MYEFIMHYALYNYVNVMWISKQSYDSRVVDDYLWELAFSSLDIVLVTWRDLIKINELVVKIQELCHSLENLAILTPPLKYAWVMNSLPFAVTFSGGKSQRQSEKFFDLIALSQLTL